ncbi:ABC transporter permease [Stenotrophomonas panacihumi]|uniref:ABC transporter permease n=1 Tax=Stenotrophomonas panacihumi TaxID=676599 RepID=A0A0Q9ZZR0_9GAMM|nr:ABC transporter permease [Stenotrophomonas panacihumi]KRG38397.1 ABC transporter permease [Stenotrophomonas panacihumi]PTN54295.1 ABC transporter permease [Stenotrophomonas panacihumi]
MNSSSIHAPQWPIYLAEARCELLRVLRTPAFVVPSLAFPLVFYLMFGVLLGHGQASVPLLASYTVFGAMAPGLFGFGIGLALDRERGLLTLKRALPAPPAAWLVARVAMAMVFAATIATLLIIAGGLFGGVQLAPMQACALLAVGVFAALPFCAIGLLVGSFAPASAAPAVVNLVYLPMSLLSGLWMPLSVLPPVFSTLAPLWPAWHLGQLARMAVGLQAQGAAWAHVAVPLVIAALCLLLAQRRLRRE